MEKLIKVFGFVIPTFFVTEGGVSLSEVSRIQAEHKQANDGFWTKVLEATEGVHRQVVTVVEGSGKASEEIDSPLITVGEINMYRDVATRNATTSVLMHGVKLWQKLQKELEVLDLRLYVVVGTPPTAPERPAFPEAPEEPVLPEAPESPERPARGTVCSTEAFMELQNIDEMIASLKSEVLATFDFVFWKRANELNSRAATLGKLLSEQGAFFRKLVTPLPKGKSETTTSGVVITSWKRAYTPEGAIELGRTREDLQAEYNDLQKQLNGCRKQVKDAVREYNLAEERQYQVALNAYRLATETHRLAVGRIRTAYDEALRAHGREIERIRIAYHEAMEVHGREMEQIRSAAETFRQEALQELAGLRVRTE
jgi:hypothetical protein